MYQHLFFDLDRTLWDFETNSRQALREIFDHHGLTTQLPFSEFISSYEAINDRLWSDYSKGKIEKEELRWRRFELALKEFNVSDINLCKAIADDYVEISPLKTALIPYTIEILDYLGTKYQLHVITNGFNEAQFKKIKNSGLEKYFGHIVTSEIAGCKKPHPAIFHYSMQLTKAEKRNSVMIGDNLEADIDGAIQAGIDSVYFNPKRVDHKYEPTYEIACLSELMKLL